MTSALSLQDSGHTNRLNPVFDTLKQKVPTIGGLGQLMTGSAAQSKTSTPTNLAPAVAAAAVAAKAAKARINELPKKNNK